MQSLDLEFRVARAKFAAGWSGLRSQILGLRMAV